MKIKNECWIILMEPVLFENNHLKHEVPIISTITEGQYQKMHNNESLNFKLAVDSNFQWLTS